MNSKPAHFKKTNYIIEAKYKLGVMETFLFTQAYMTMAEDDQSGSHKIYFRDVIQNFGLNPKGDTYDNIVRAARSLRSREIAFRPVNESGEEEVEVFTGFFTKVKVHKRKSNDLACLEVFIDDDLKPHLVALKRYTLLNKDRYAWICGCLRNPLIIRLYDLLKQYEKIGWRRFQIEELKTMLQIDDKYKLYGSLKQKVVIEAQRLFKQYADVAFSFKEEKKGKAVDTLVFTIFKNIPTHAPDNVRQQLLADNERALASGETAPTTIEIGKKENGPENPLFPEFLETMKSWGISEANFREMLAKHDAETIRRAVKNTKSWQAAGKMTANAAGFFVKALREKWKTAEETKLEQLSERKRRETEAREQNDIKLNALQIQLAALQDTRRGEINQIIREMTASDGAVGVRAVQGIKENMPVVRMLKRVHGIENLEDMKMEDFRQNPLLRDQVIMEIMRQQPEKFEAVRQRYDETIGQLEAQLKKLRG